MGDTIKIGLIGSGRAGMIHARNMAYRIKDAQMVLVCDTDSNSARQAAQELGCGYCLDYKELLHREEIDAVIVTVPTKYHRDIAVEAAKAGKHIFCEKPMAMNVQECRDMIRAAEENRVVLQIGFMRRFDEGFRRAKEIIDSGKIGKVVMVKSLTHGPSTPHEWMYDIGKSNGPLAEVNSHDIDTIRWLTGSEIKSVYAVAGNYRCEQAQESYPDFYDSVLMSIRMCDETIGCIDGAQGVAYGYDARVEVMGTRGLVTVGGLQDQTAVTYTRDGGMEGDVVRSWTTLFSEAYAAEDESFVKCIRERKKPEADGWDGMMAVAAVKAGNESIRSGSVVILKQEEREWKL